MPFKGDERLGGPHDNEAKLNGTSDGPSVPPAGTYVRTENNVLWPIANGGGYLAFTDANGQHHDVPNQTATVDVEADGLGGEVYDWSTATNTQYLAHGTTIGVGQTTFTTAINVELYGLFYQVGVNNNTYVHDGYGSVTTTSTQSYFPEGTFLFTKQGIDLISNYLGVDYVVGTKDINFYCDGEGGTYTEDASLYPYQDYTNLGYRNGETVNVYVPELNSDYPAGTAYYEVYVYQGQATDSGAAYGTNWYESGTLVTEGSYYYWDGTGGYYYSEPAPSTGPTGNTSSGDNYININGTDYNNGTYSGTEYNDGSGGTYWSYEYSYQPYGYEFFSDSYYDEGSMMNVTTSYRSDNAGGYYTETV